MTVEYSRAKEAEKVGTALINKHHRGLNGIRIEYLFRDKTAKSGGREVWGKTTKVSGLHAYLAGESESLDAAPGESFFVIVLAKPVWDILDKPTREALIDHELCHCAAEFNDDGDVALKVRPPDVAEFAGVIERHGLWRDEVTTFVKAAVESGQLTFDDDDKEAGE